jgi:hypothetical protein
MALTQKEKFEKAAYGGPAGGNAQPIPEFPKLPAFLKRLAKSDEDKKDLEKYEAEVTEFFKKVSRSGGL